MHNQDLQSRSFGGIASVSQSATQMKAHAKGKSVSQFLLSKIANVSTILNANTDMALYGFHFASNSMSAVHLRGLS